MALTTQRPSTRAAATTGRQPTPCMNRPVRAPFIHSSSTRPARASTVRVHSDNPARQALSGLVAGIYKATASFQQVDSSLPPLWQALMKLDKGAVQAALRNGADPNEVNVQGVLGHGSLSGYLQETCQHSA
jgi:hypothetical protein